MPATSFFSPVLFILFCLYQSFLFSEFPFVIRGHLYAGRGGEEEARRRRIGFGENLGRRGKEEGAEFQIVIWNRISWMLTLDLVTLSRLRHYTNQRCDKRHLEVYCPHRFKLYGSRLKKLLPEYGLLRSPPLLQPLGHDFADVRVAAVAAAAAAAAAALGEKGLGSEEGGRRRGALLQVFTNYWRV